MSDKTIPKPPPPPGWRPDIIVAPLNQPIPPGAAFEAILKDVRRETRPKGAHTIEAVVRGVDKIVASSR